MKQPTTPLPCPICGRKPKLREFIVECHDFDSMVNHEIIICHPTNMRPIAQWNAYVRRIRNRISKENAK